MTENEAASDGLRLVFRGIQERLVVYTDGELREIKNSADVFSMHIRMELAARDARAVDVLCARGPRQDPPHPMFRDHDCAYCGSGKKPCKQGNPSQCEFPHARND